MMQIELQFGDFIYNPVVYPTVIMKTLKGCDETVGSVNGQRMVSERKLNSRSREYFPFDFYPAPNAQSVQDVEYVVEIRKCSRSELVGYYSAPGFDGEGTVRY